MRTIQNPRSDTRDSTAHNLGSGTDATLQCGPSSVRGHPAPMNLNCTTQGHVIIALVRSSHICDDERAAGIELHDEIVEWMASLDTTEWDRTVIVIDRLADLGSMARMPFSKALGDGLFELRFTLGPTSRRIT